jgi:hypothetical protein
MMLSGPSVTPYSQGYTVQVSFTPASVTRQLTVDLGISLDHRQQWIKDEMDKCVKKIDSLGEKVKSLIADWLLHHGESTSSSKS